MNIAICDDEESMRSYIRNLIEKQKVDCQIAEFSSGKELLRFQEQKENAIDILFLDISMKDMDGMMVAKQMREQRKNRQEAVWGSLPLLIFVTGCREYMSEAFSVNAFQYMVKPVKESEFADVFAQAVREYRCLTDQRTSVSKEILVRNGTTTRSVLADDIYYIESNSRKIILHLANEKIEYYDKISELEHELKQSFFRIHKGYLVNMKYVERYERTEVCMKNKDRLLISKYRYQDFVKAYLNYIR